MDIELLKEVQFELQILGVSIQLGKLIKRYNIKKNELDLSSMGLTILPINSIVNLNPLGLTLTDNKINTLPIQISQIQQLEKIDLSFNELTEFGELTNCINLRWLDLGDNKIQDIPEKIGNLDKLKWLDLRGNLIKDTNYLHTLNSLERLSLSRNYVSNLHDICKCNKLKLLILEDNMLTQIPDRLGELKELIFLQLMGNRITKLIPAFEKLINLHGLDLRNNIISEININFSLLESLNILRIDGNRISQLPKNFGNLKQLKIFHCGYNIIEELPKTFSNLKLKEFHAEFNLLTKLPIINLSQLTILDLSFNRLTDVPNYIKYAEIRLNTTGNPII